MVSSVFSYSCIWFWDEFVPECRNMLSVCAGSVGKKTYANMWHE